MVFVSGLLVVRQDDNIMSIIWKPREQPFALQHAELVQSQGQQLSMGKQSAIEVILDALS